MTLTASDFIVYGSTDRPTDDSDAVGGSIDTAARPFDAELSSAQAVELLSSSSGDSRTATVVYRTTEGETFAWNPTLAGTSAVSLSTGTPEYLLSVSLSSASTDWSVTVRASTGTVLHTLNPDETDAFRLFQFAYSKSTQEVRYEKVFLKNVSTDTDLSSGTVQLTSDASTQYRIGLSATKDSTDGWANRLTDPGYSWSDSSQITIPTTTLGAGEAIGIGVEQTLAADATAGFPSFQIQIGGESLAST